MERLVGRAEEEGRTDDSPEVIAKRLETYHAKTKPLVALYEKRGILQRVDGSAPPEEVTDSIRGLLATLRREEEMEI